MKGQPYMEKAIEALEYPEEWIGCRWCGQPFKPPPSMKGRTRMCNQCRRERAKEKCLNDIDTGKRSDWDFCRTCHLAYKIRPSHPYDHECNDCLSRKHPQKTGAEKQREKTIALLEEVAKLRRELGNDPLFDAYDEAIRNHKEERNM